MYDLAGGNPWAAMPSLHFATSLMAALLLAEIGPIPGALGVGYAAALAFALVYLGSTTSTCSPAPRSSPWCAAASRSPSPPSPRSTGSCSGWSGSRPPSRGGPRRPGCHRAICQDRRGMSRSETNDWRGRGGGRAWPRAAHHGGRRRPERGGGRGRGGTTVLRGSEAARADGHLRCRDRRRDLLPGPSVAGFEDGLEKLGEGNRVWLGVRSPSAS